MDHEKQPVKYASIWPAGCNGVEQAVFIVCRAVKYCAALAFKGLGMVVGL